MSEKIPISWVRKLDAEHPKSNVHTFSRPPVLEALSLLPVAYRVGSYISNERSHGREPIFDLHGIALEPPNPGPNAGVPLGGLGGGSIGRGFKGEFGRWSLNPGRYVHRNVQSDVFAIRIKRNSEIFSTVLSVFPPDESSCLFNWNWTLDPACATYHALYPRSWTVYESPVPGVRVIIRQVSPFLPHNYSDSSLPVGVFVVEVENTDETHPVEVSILFSFQNGFDSTKDIAGGYAHSSFHMHRESVDGEGPSGAVRGVCMAHHTVLSDQENEGGIEAVSVDQGSYAIASLVEDGDEGVQSSCAQYVTGHTHTSHFFHGLCSSASSDVAASINLWNQFEESGDIGDDPQAASRVSRSGTKVGAAVCLRKQLAASNVDGSNKKTFSFSLAWDNPVVRFKGSMENGLRRYYTKFFGVSGLAAPYLAVFGLLKVSTWEEAITLWQKETLSKTDGGLSNNAGATHSPHKAPFETGGDTELDSPLVSDESAKSAAVNPISVSDQSPLLDNHTAKVPSQTTNGGSYYSHQLFNELYFLVDGGTVWTDTTNGVNNSTHAIHDPHSSGKSAVDIAVYVNDATVTTTTAGDSSEERQPIWNQCSGGEGQNATSKHVNHHLSHILFGGVHGEDKHAVSQTDSAPCGVSVEALDRLMSLMSFSKIHTIEQVMEQNNALVSTCAGNQSAVGQFLYLEGHEYLMYNTYDVHFYSSYALLMLWPQLELSLQRDFATAVPLEDHTIRRMMGEGDLRPRKVKGIVPHDLGSPSESPWRSVNAYNFQDVSRWKDLGPKFVLQIYRDYRYLKDTFCCENSELDMQIDSFLKEMFPVLLTVMQSTQQFDSDGDGMIENGGFPDQTYDIWTATGVHAYCGGLWITACEATAAVGRILGDDAVRVKYSELATRARLVYVSRLWNGEYLDYDSSRSGHHDSVMADMLAGQWYARACHLPPVVTPQQALSCFRTIYRLNVVAFGAGRFLGAVNGMKPNGRVDNCCLQSREVWTGTTYALAASMLHESMSRGDSTTPSLTAEERQELQIMSHNTARGIHDAGWVDFGYWFATPEAWERSGNYRSLGYMRPLSIWAIQYAKERGATELVMGGEQKVEKVVKD